MRVTMQLEIKKRLAAEEKVLKVAAAVTRELARGGATIEGQAKHLCPVNMGQLRAGIRFFMVRDKTLIAVRIGTPYRYAQFVEFGTGPKGKEGPHNATAMKLMAELGYVHGSGGKMPPLSVIARWVKRKGIDSELVFPIARAIAKNGLRARPFLTPPFQVEAPKTLLRVANVVKAALESQV